MRGEFLASTDERFRPVNLSLAPDGTLYVVDMYRGIIQHKGYMTEYLRDYVLTHKLDAAEFVRPHLSHRPREHQARHDAAADARARRRSSCSCLSHPNGWRRDMAQQLLVERGDKSVVPALRKLASSAGDVRTRLHALWTLDGLDAIEPTDVMPALVAREQRRARVGAAACGAMAARRRTIRFTARC